MPATHELGGQRPQLFYASWVGGALCAATDWVVPPVAAHSAPPTKTKIEFPLHKYVVKLFPAFDDAISIMLTLDKVADKDYVYR